MARRVSQTSHKFVWPARTQSEKDASSKASIRTYVRRVFRYWEERNIALRDSALHPFGQLTKPGRGHPAGHAATTSGLPAEACPMSQRAWVMSCASTATLYGAASQLVVRKVC